jgi:hypothetical protein
MILFSSDHRQALPSEVSLVSCHGTIGDLPINKEARLTSVDSVRLFSADEDPYRPNFLRLQLSLRRHWYGHLVTRIMRGMHGPSNCVSELDTRDSRYSRTLILTSFHQGPLRVFPYNLCLG